MKQVQSQELEQTLQRYVSELNQLNLLLLREHDLQTEQRIYRHEMANIDATLDRLARGPAGASLQAEEQHLRASIRNNEREISLLNHKRQDKLAALDETTKLREVHGKYGSMFQTDFQSGIQQKLSNIRGKVDELKKKIKEINKEIIGYEQIHYTEVEEYSGMLARYSSLRKRNSALQQEVERLRLRTAP